MEIFALILFLGLVASLILPWLNMGRISSQRAELEHLRRELSDLRARRGGEVSEVADLAGGTGRESVYGATAESCDPGEAALAGGTARGSVYGADAEIRDPGEPVEPQDWFSKLAVWVGGVALLMAGFYMVKYSMESGWLTPVVRLWLTTGFGALLCGAGFVIGIKSSMAGNERIGQALSGAGIACWYFAAYAAVHMYGFLSPGQGFTAMLVVTVLAVALSLKNGAPIAMMGLVGGFLTPWLMSTGSNDTGMLFGYLFLLFCGAQFLCVRRGWWALLLGSLAGAYLWSAVVIVGNLSGTLDNLKGTLLFVLGICAVNAVWVFLAKRDSQDAASVRLLTAIRLLTWGGGLVQGLVLVLIGGFAAVDMALFSLLSVAALVLAVLREDEFIWAAWLALGAVAAGALSNTDAGLLSWLLTPLGLMGLFFAVGHWRGLVSERVLCWRGLSVAAAILVVPLLYLNREWANASVEPMPASSWLWLAVAAAGLLALAGEHLFRREEDAEVAGEYSAFAVFVLGFGLWTYLPESYLAHAAAGLLIAAALYWRRRGFGRAALVVSVLGLAWAGWMFFYALEAVSYFFRQDIYAAPEQDRLAVLAWALGVAGAGTVFACFKNVWPQRARKIVLWVLGLVGLLAFVATYQWLDETQMPSGWSAMSVEGGLTALLALAAVACIYLARKWQACQLASVILGGLAALRVVLLHLTDSGAEGSSFFWNALLLQFGLPFVAACVLAWQSGAGGFERLRRVYQTAAMLLGFIWATFLVQDYYGGSELLCGSNSSTEIYTYSVVWLLLAVVYQAIGLWRKQSAIHVGSLILLLITIGKVFLIDASELEGLFRVLSFLGLGLALIGIGFFYNKVVFARRGQGAKG